MPETKKEKFERKMIDILNYGALNLAMGIGYKTGLFDAMEAIGTPATAGKIAARANLTERYVTEWLGVMATGGVIDVVTKDASGNRFFLPADHAACLTRRSGDANLGVYTQEIPLLTQCALPAVERGFTTGAGVPFAVYPAFQAFMGELSDAKHKKVLVQQFLPEVAEGRLLQRLKKGIAACDLGCGEGVAVLLMAARFPNSHFTGIDNHKGAIDAARAEALEKRLENCAFILQDAAGIDGNAYFENRYDYIMAFDAIHDQQKPLEALRGIRHMLTPDGLFSMVDIDADSDLSKNLDHPMGPFLYAVSLMHCMPVGLADGGAGLGMMWGRQKAVAMLKEAGFSGVQVCEMAHDPFNVHYLSRK